MKPLHEQTLSALRAGLQQKAFSSVELTQHFLDRIKDLDSKVNSFVTVCDETALASAKAADEAIAKGNMGTLTGLPIAQKDIFCTRGIKTTCGSKMLDNFIAPYNATVIEKFDTAGAVMIGKTNMDEFAMGSSNENSFYGPVHNPWQLDSVPGGSSGGAAACVAAGFAPGATGTDTGGSIRQPAALCGITGLKPTYGRVSRFGMIAFASSLDQGGPMAKSAEDCAWMLNAMAGYDPKDSTSVDEAVPDYTANLTDSIKGLKIGLPKEFFAQGLDGQVEEAIQTAIKVLEAEGATVHEISLPRVDLSLSAYYILATAECSANLARYDGVRFGYRCENPKDLTDLYVRSRSEAFGPEVKRRILLGTYALSAGYYDAYYAKAQKIRRLISEDLQKAFAEVDVIAGPTAPTPTFKLGAKTDDPVQMYLNDIYTIAANLAGLPGLSLPAGQVDGLPVGLQLIGRHFEEARLLNVGHNFQQQTDWHTRCPEFE